MKTKILGVAFDTYTPGEALAIAMSFTDEHGPAAKTIYTPNPELVMHARKDERFMRVLNEGDLVVPDGIGVVYASKFNKLKIKHRVAGYDLVQAMFAKLAQTGKTVYFLGGKKESVTVAKENMEKQYPGLKIIGLHDGFFDEKEEILLLSEIRTLQPDVLLVGLGFPRQEFWIADHKSSLPVRVMIGIGGSIDGMSGRVKRAPKIFQRLGLEWFYRLLKQPSRFKRQLVLPWFMITVIGVKLFGKKQR